MMNEPDEFDAIVIGGGPSGAVAGRILAQAGRRVVVLEKVAHPRFHIGESFLPQALALIKQIGLIDEFRALPHVVKWGAEFGFGYAEDDQTARFHFRDTLEDGPRETFNIERSHFDAMLLRGAADVGATVLQNMRVDEILQLEEGGVAVRCGERTLRARWLLDASGQSTVLGRHLNTRRVVTSLENVAYFGHFRGCQRLRGEEEGHPTIVMCDEGWFWMIPINEEVTSCGLVINRHAAKRVNVPADQMLRWGIERTPLIRRRTAGATFPAKNGVIADFTYRCEPYAGPGYFLIGDAATFIDPIFSTGACLGMMHGHEAANLILGADAGRLSARAARKRYIRYVNQSNKHMFKLVHGYYRHSFRELFLNESGPGQMHKAVISLLAGHVFPKPSFALVSRFWAFQVCIAIQKWLPLVPRRKPFSLLAQPDPAPSPAMAAQGATV